VFFERSERERLLSGYPEREDRMLLTGPPARLREISFDQDPTAQFVVDARSHLLLVNAAQQVRHLVLGGVGSAEEESTSEEPTPEEP
jgi:hypothetical protein